MYQETGVAFGVRGWAIFYQCNIGGAIFTVLLRTMEVIGLAGYERVSRSGQQWFMYLIYLLFLPKTFQ